MSIPCAVLMCHAPIVIPEIGGPESNRCAATTQAMQRAADRLLATRPDVLVVVSPHAPRRPDAWGIVRDSRLSGDFRRFGLPDLGLIARGAPLAVSALETAAGDRNLKTWDAPGRTLDHGTLVPLHFVTRAGWNGPTLVVSFPAPGTGTETTMGAAIAAAAGSRGERWALLASGDMSHRLKPGAPSGYDPRAQEFDAALVDKIRTGDLRAACATDEDLRNLAAEDVLESVAVAAGATHWDARGHDVLCYEGPFGVGYLEAILYDAGAKSDEETPLLWEHDAPSEEALTVARDAIARALRRDPPRQYDLPPPTFPAWGVFVTLRELDGALRGCMGHIESPTLDLGREVADCARLAATRDPRFPPVSEGDLRDLRIEVSVLEPPSPIVSLSDLDPKSFGVVVRSGLRRGLLLPDIEGVDTPEEQVRIAMRKGDIEPHEKWTVERFRVRKVSEKERESS